MFVRGKRSLLASASSLAIFSAGMLAGVPTGAVAQDAEEDDAFVLEVITVTATRRDETIQDVPYNISAVSGQQMKDANVSSLVDLTRFVPGVAFADLGPRSSGLNNQLILRGLNANDQGGIGAFINQNTPAGVATYLNDTPLFTNLKIADLERVEVLRGPQGTLYGAGSIGGTLRFIFNKPDTEAFSATFDAGLSFMDDSDDVNYNFDGVVNVPLSDKMALRVAAGYEQFGGFVDANALAVGGPDGSRLVDPTMPFSSPLLTERVEDTDSADQWYLRASLLWDVTEDVEAYFTYHRQVDDAEDISVETNSAAPFAVPRSHDLPFTSPLNREVDVFALELDIDLGFALLESSTSFTKNEAVSSGDLSGLVRAVDVGSFGSSFGGYPFFNPGLRGYFEDETVSESFAQEIRLVSQGDSKLEWLVGFYYQDLKTDVVDVTSVPGFAEYANTPGQPLLADPFFASFFGLPPGFTFNDFGVFTFADFLGGFPLFVQPSAISNEVFVSFDESRKTEDIAFFGELTYNFTDRWDMTFGARVFWNDVDASLDYLQPLLGTLGSPSGLDPSGAGSVTASDDVSSEIFRINTSYDISDDLTFYATWSEGFRRGGANAFPISGFVGEDPSLVIFEPDTVTNYEIGLKGNVDNRFNFTAALFRIDWENPQVAGATAPGGFPVVYNAGDARTQGIELEARLNVTENLTLSGGYSYVDAEFREDFAATPGPAVPGFPPPTSDFFAEAGNRLPGVPESSATWALEYTQPVSFLGFSDIYARVDGSYRSDVVTSASPDLAAFTTLDGFSMWNASITANHENFRVTVFVRNIGDEAGIAAVQRNFSAAGPDADFDFLSRPRTIGVSVSTSF